MSSSIKINDMAEFVGATGLEYGEDYGLTPNEMINAMVVSLVVMAFALKKGDSNAEDLKARLVEAVAEVFDDTLEFSHAEA